MMVAAAPSPLPLSPPSPPHAPPLLLPLPANVNSVYTVHVVAPAFFSVLSTEEPSGATTSTAALIAVTGVSHMIKGGKGTH